MDQAGDHFQVKIAISELSLPKAGFHQNLTLEISIPSETAVMEGQTHGITQNQWPSFQFHVQGWTDI